jgi:hypothetical protein
MLQDLMTGRVVDPVTSSLQPYADGFTQIGRPGYPRGASGGSSNARLPLQPTQQDQAEAEQRPGGS